MRPWKDPFISIYLSICIYSVCVCVCVCVYVCVCVCVCVCVYCVWTSACLSLSLSLSYLSLSVCRCRCLCLCSMCVACLMRLADSLILSLSFCLAHSVSRTAVLDYWDPDQSKVEVCARLRVPHISHPHSSHTAYASAYPMPSPHMHTHASAC
jgi:hypothetical protein